MNLPVAICTYTNTFFLLSHYPSAAVSPHRGRSNAKLFLRCVKMMSVQAYFLFFATYHTTELFEFRNQLERYIGILFIIFLDARKM